MISNKVGGSNNKLVALSLKLKIIILRLVEDFIVSGLCTKILVRE